MKILSVNTKVVKRLLITPHITSACSGLDWARRLLKGEAKVERICSLLKRSVRCFPLMVDVSSPSDKS
jgi:hypothetical protein